MMPLALRRSTASWSLLAATAVIVGACQTLNEPNPSIEGSRRLAVGAATACALDPVGKVFCWGVNSNLLEYGTTTVLSSGTPVAVPVPQLLSISGGWGQHKCGLTSSGAICWGRGLNGQLGDGTAGATGNPPANVAVQEPWVDISTGRLTTCALNSAGDAFCWGLNQFGEVGDTLLPLSTRQLTPNRVVGGVKFSTVVAGWLHTCGISTAGIAYCWGNNTSGQLGIGVIDSVAHGKPLPVASTLHFAKIAMSARSTCAVSTDGQLLCWGYNGLGQLGDGTTDTHGSPTPVSGTKKWKDVAMGNGFVEGTVAVGPTGLAQGGTTHACAIDDSDATYCWGWNGAGQLGDGSTTTRQVPTAISSTLKFNSLGLGSAYSCGTTSSGIYCWGANSVGQLGIGTTQDAAQPVKVLTGW
jgi:alpha-tubulin suppressor-like RCC1 family protein